MKFSILTTTHNRNSSLQNHLTSLTSQQISEEFEILVLDDYYLHVQETEDISNSFPNTRYLHTGKTKNNKDYWRVPGFALNIGAKLCSGDAITITGCDIKLSTEYDYQRIISLFNDNLVTVRSIKVEGSDSRQRTDSIRMPFFMTIPKQTFIDIGGYDEDFIGVAGEDNDLMDRLMSVKSLISAPVTITHQSHEDVPWDERREYNYKLWKDRKGLLVRNQNREWGVYE